MSAIYFILAGLCLGLPLGFTLARRIAARRLRAVPPTPELAFVTTDELIREMQTRSRALRAHHLPAGGPEQIGGGDRRLRRRRRRRPSGRGPRPA